MEMFRD